MILDLAKWAVGPEAAVLLKLGGGRTYRLVKVTKQGDTVTCTFEAEDGSE